jgi:DNA-binding transcriptional LysR family regulator
MAFHDDNLVEELIYEEELVLITQPEIRDVEAIRKQPFLMNTIGCPNREELESWLKSVGSCPIRYLEFNHLDAIIQGVVSGLGASLVPKSAIQQQVEDGLLQTFSMPSQAVYTKTYFIRHKDVFVTSALERFLELLRGASL